MNKAFLDKLISRVGRLQSGDVKSWLVELAKEKGFLETIFDAIFEGVIVADGEGRLLYMNRAAGAFFGVDPAQYLGKSLGETIPDLDWQNVVAAGEVSTRDIEVFYPVRRLLNFYAVPLVGDKEDRVGSAIILHDITRSQQAAQKNIEEEKLSALTLLAAGVAHEIGNPLNSLGIHLQLLERQARAFPPEHRRKFGETLSIAQQEVERLDQIISQFLKAIRPCPLTFAPVNLNVLIEECLEFFKSEISNRDILLEKNLATDLPVLSGDFAQLKQAVYNIIRNSLQAMPRGGILYITTASNETSASIAVSDTGAGISPEDIGHIFEPYYTTKEKGNGIGLLIVHRIIHAHGGRVSVESAPGRGTTVTLSLPRRDHSMKLLPAQENPALR